MHFVIAFRCSINNIYYCYYYTLSRPPLGTTEHYSTKAGGKNLIQITIYVNAHPEMSASNTCTAQCGVCVSVSVCVFRSEFILIYACSLTCWWALTAWTHEYVCVRERKRACLRGKLSPGRVNGSSVGRLCHSPSLPLCLNKAGQTMLTPPL